MKKLLLVFRKMGRLAERKTLITAGPIIRLFFLSFFHIDDIIKESKENKPCLKKGGSSRKGAPYGGAVTPVPGGVIAVTQVTAAENAVSGCTKK